MERIIVAPDGTYRILVESFGGVPIEITKDGVKGFPTANDALAWLTAERMRRQQMPS
jgi:hypothetical protein